MLKIYVNWSFISGYIDADGDLTTKQILQHSDSDSGYHSQISLDYPLVGNHQVINFVSIKIPVNSRIIVTLNP